MPGPWEFLLDPTVGLATGALAFGILWTVVNFYNYYPLAQVAATRIVSLLSGASIPEDAGQPSLPADPPRIDILLPAYEESAVIEQAITSVLKARYPDDCLHLTVLLEPGDEATLTAVRAVDSDQVTVEVIPEAYPGNPNKPRALNYGFEQTAGEIVGVIDAEDIVSPDLFVETAAEMADGAEFAQTRLDMANEGDGWLNLLFRAEYGYWYELVTPAFASVEYPIPLAGTCCFVRREALEAASFQRLASRGNPWDEEEWAWAREHNLSGARPWDPQNVTEDFELGLLLWEHDFEFAYLDAVTREESPQSLDEWLDQRTRWQKGKIYTFLDRRGDPPDATRKSLHITWQSLLPHLGPINVMGAVLVGLAASLAKFRPAFVVGVALSVGTAFAVSTATLFAVGYWAASDTPHRTRSRRAVVVGLTLPLYWLFQWLADIQALVKVYGGDLAWERTEHVGVDTTVGGVDPRTVSRAREYTLHTRVRWGALAAILLIGAVLRWFALVDWGLWADELYTVTRRGALSIPDILLAPTDPHPPLYYLLVHWWMALLGDGVFIVRALSILFSLGAMVTVYHLGTELFDDRTGLIAALFVSVSAFHVHFGRIARMYSLLVFLTALSLYYFARVRDGTTRSAAGYVLATAALVYTHVYGLFVLVGQAAYATLSGHNAGVPRERWYRIGGMLGLLVVPWVLALGWRIGKILVGAGGTNIEWIPEPTAILLTRTVTAFVGFSDLYPVEAGSLPLYVLASAVVCVFVFQLLASIVQANTEQIALDDINGVAPLVSVGLAVTAVPFIVSYAIPIYVPRYAAPASVAFVVLGARGLRNVPLRRLRFGLLAVVTASSLIFLIPYYTTGSTEPWAEVTESVETTIDSEEILLSQPDTGAVDYYLDANVTTGKLPVEGSTTADDLAYLRELTTEYSAITVVRYYQSTGPTYTFLGLCYERFSVSRAGAIEVVQYSGAVDCPAPERVIGNATDTPEPTRRGTL